MEKEIDEWMYAKNFEDAYDKILCYGISLLEALYGKKIARMICKDIIIGK